MSRKDSDPVAHIGRRFKLRDLQILFSVAQHGSMAKAAAHLATTQPTVSQAIADLEDIIGVRLFDRSTQGVVPTAYGRILLKRGGDAFDALKQGLRDIEFLATSGAGDIWIGCPEPVLLGFVPEIIQRIAALHPQITVHVVDVNPAENEFHRLREQKLDLMIGRCAHLKLDDDLAVETLYEESFSIVTGFKSPWARRRKVVLMDLMDEPWLYGEPSNATQTVISQAIHARTGRLPHVAVYTTSMSLRLSLLSTGRYISCVPDSIYQHGSQGQTVRALPLDFELKLPIGLYTLKNRTLSPVVGLFIEQVRETAKKMTQKN